MATLTEERFQSYQLPGAGLLLSMRLKNPGGEYPVAPLLLRNGSTVPSKIDRVDVPHKLEEETEFKELIMPTLTEEGVSNLPPCPEARQLLSKSWKNPADEYPVTPLLLRNGVSSEVIDRVGGVPDKLDETELAKVQYELYQLQQGDGPPVSRSRHESALDASKRYHDAVKANYLGFQANLANSYTHLAHYLDNHLNNVGDPFLTGNHMNQTKYMERAVLDYFAALWRAEWPHDCYQKGSLSNPQNPSSYWGFVLSMGCTEGTLYGLWNGRDYLSGKVMLMDEALGETQSTPEVATRPLPKYVMPKPLLYKRRRGFTHDPYLNRLTPICFFSEDSHYSLQKSMVILNIRTFHDEATQEDAYGNLKYPKCPLKGYDSWPEKVPSNPDGSVNVEALVTLVEFFASKGYPPLICFNFGTTFKGSYDDVERASQLLIPILDKYGLAERVLEVKDSSGKKIKVKRSGFWIHVDGALGAAYIPFLRMAQACNKFPKDLTVPEFDFSLRGPKPKNGSTTEKDFSHVEVVHSIAMSAHKFIGAPFPTGVYMTKSKLQLMPPEIPNVVGTPDTTFAGSRNGLASVILWDHFARRSFDELMEKAVYTQKTATYLVEELEKLDSLMKEGKLHPQLKERDLWIQHWSRSLGVVFRRPNDKLVKKYCLSKETENGRYLVHAYAMEHVTKDLIDKFIVDLSVDGAFEEQS
ncbi:unnamed protein product [Calypogeia fissa]